MNSNDADAIVQAGSNLHHGNRDSIYLMQLHALPNYMECYDNSCMNLFSKLFRLQEATEKTQSDNAHLADFLQIADPSKPAIMFQVAEDDTRRIMSAFADGGFVRFTTTFGRQCPLNLDRLPFIRHFKAPSSSTSSFKIDGALVHLSNTESMDIPTNQNQIKKLFGSIAAGEGVAKIGEWKFKASSLVSVVVAKRFGEEVL